MFALIIVMFVQRMITCDRHATSLTPAHNTHPRSDLNLDGGAASLTRNLGAAVRRQLDSSWHTLPWGTRQRVMDLATVQGLAGLLLESDAATFLT